MPRRTSRFNGPGARVARPPAAERGCSANNDDVKKANIYSAGNSYRASSAERLLMHLDGGRMKRLLGLLIILATTIGVSGALLSAERVTIGNDVLRDCSLALEMGQPGFMNDILSKGKPLPSNARQNMATQCLSYVVGFKDAIYVSQIYQEKNGKSPFVCLRQVPNSV